MFKRIKDFIWEIIIVVLWLIALPSIIRQELKDEEEWNAEGIKDVEDESPKVKIEKGNKND